MSHQKSNKKESIPDQSLAPFFRKTLEARRAIRVFDGKPIPEELVMDCMRQAILAPTSSNLQPFQLFWVRDPSKRALVAKACMNQSAATTAGELIVITARRDLWDTNRKKLLNVMTDDGKLPLPKKADDYYNKLITKVMRDDGFGLFNTFRRVAFTLVGLKQPIVRSPVSKADHRIWAQVQASLVAQTLMLAFTAHGYDTCPMGGFDEKRLKKILKLPPQAEINMVISAGIRKPEGLYGPRYRLKEEDLISVV